MSNSIKKSLSLMFIMGLWVFWSSLTTRFAMEITTMLNGMIIIVIGSLLLGVITFYVIYLADLIGSEKEAENV